MTSRSARLGRPASLGAVTLVATLILLGAKAPAGAQSAPSLPSPRTATLKPRVVALQPRVMDIAPKQTAPNTFAVDSDVLFAFNVATLSPDAEAVLGTVVNQLKASGAGTVMIAGYTDSIGDSNYNVTLSQKRAASVQSFLQANVANGALTYQAQGLGEANPVAPNTNPDGSDSPTGRQQNRRVVITYTAG